MNFIKIIKKTAKYNSKLRNLITNLNFLGVFNVLMGLCHKYGKNGNCVNWSIGNIFIVLITNPKDVENLLNNKAVEKSAIYKFISPWLGRGLLTASGQNWQDHRKLITPAFHFKILEGFVDNFNENNKKLVEMLRSKASLEEFDIYNMITAVTLDNICGKLLPT